MKNTTLFKALMFIALLATSQISFAQTVIISPTGDGGFETGTTFAANGWTAVNSGSGNQWFCSNFVASAGARSAYVSSTATGTSNNYSNWSLSNATRVQHFYRNVNFPAGETSITLNFKWRCNGQSGSDDIKVFLVPTTTTPVAGTALPGANQIAGPYTGQSSYQTVSVTLSAALAGTTQRLVFSWRNNNDFSGSNPAGSFDEISLTSCTPPSVSASNNGPLCAGSNLDLSSTSSAGTFSWTGPNGFTSSSQNPTISSATAAASGTYTVIATSGGCSASSTTNATVNATTSISAHPAVQIKCEGANATFSVTASGTSVTYQWQDNSLGSFADIAGATSSSLVVNGVTLGMSGTLYQCIVSGSCGVVNSNSAELTVNPVPVVSASSSPVNGVICGTGSATLTASGGTTYSWNPGGSTSASISVSPLSTTTYTVTGTTNGCSATASQAVTVYPAVTALASASLSTLCQNGNTDLTAAGGNSTNYSVTSIPYSSPLGSGSSATSGDDAVSGSIALPFTFSFYGVNYNNLYVYTNGFVQLGTSSSSTGVYGQTLPSATNPNNIIAGVLSDLNANANTITTFSTGSTPNRVFTIYYNNVAFYCSGTGGGCSGNKRGNVNFQIRLYEKSNIIEVHMNNLTNSSSTSGALKTMGIENTNGTSAKVPAGRNGSDGNWTVSTPEAWRFTPNGGTLTYSWSPSTYLTNALILNPTAQNMQLSQNYVVTVTDQNGCSAASTAAAINVNPLPTVAVTPGSATDFCAGGNVTLTATAGLSSYSWNTTPVQTTQSINVNSLATYSVTGTDANGCSNVASQLVTVYDTLPANITVIGSTNLCTGQTTTDLQATQNNAVSYVWNTTEPTSLITVATSGNYSVTATDNFGCLHHQSQAITETAPPAAPIVVPAGSTVLCSDGITTTSVVLNTTNYSSDLLWSTSETTTGISVDYADIFTVTYTDANGCFATSNSISTEVRDYSLDPSTALNNSAYGEICNGTPASLTVNGGTLAIDASWVWYEGGCGSGASVAMGSTATPIPVGGGVHTYYVRAEGFCNVTNCVPVTVLVKTSAPTSSVSTLTAPVSACTGNTAALTVNTVSNATYYSWSGPAGILFDGLPGPYQTTSTGVTSTFGALPGSSGYSICVFGGNACGQSNTICKWVRAKVSTPGPIAGSITGCPNMSSGYSVSPVAGADTYTWTVVGNDATLNGTAVITITTPTPNVTVDFAAPFIGATLQVYASLSCGYNSSPRSISISRTPAVPGAMTGNSYVCPSTSAVYSIPTVNGAATYNWVCSVPGAVVSPAGNSASIFFPTTIPAGSSVCVTALSACGFASITRCKGIATGMPNTPSNISGPALGQCGQTGVSFSIPPVSSATSYLWTVSNGSASISGPNNLSSVSVDFTGNLNTVTLSVSAGNSCGNSGIRSLSILGKPGTPAAISGNNSVCNGSVESYMTTGSTGANLLTWSVPPTASILGGQGSNNLLVLWGSGGGQLKVYAANDCGNSANTILPVTITCRQSQLQNTIESDVKVYPNPAHDKMKVEINSLTSDRVAIDLINTLGEIVYRSEMNIHEGTNLLELNLENMAKGFYNLSILGTSVNSQHRVVVE